MNQLTSTQRTILAALLAVIGGVLLFVGKNEAIGGSLLLGAAAIAGVGQHTEAKEKRRERKRADDAEEAYYNATGTFVRPPAEKEEKKD